MMFNEVVEKLNILNDMTTANRMWLLLAVGVIFGVFFLIALIKRETFWQIPTSFGIFMLAFCVINGAYGGYCAYKEPTTIALQVSANVEDVTIEDISQYFDCSEITLNEGKLVCVVKPKRNYFDNDKSYWRETDNWLEEKGAKKEITDMSFWKLNI